MANHHTTHSCSAGDLKELYLFRPRSRGHLVSLFLLPRLALRFVISSSGILIFPPAPVRPRGALEPASIEMLNIPKIHLMDRCVLTVAAVVSWSVGRLSMFRHIDIQIASSFYLPCWRNHSSALAYYAMRKWYYACMFAFISEARVLTLQPKESHVRSTESACRT